MGETSRIGPGKGKNGAASAEWREDEGHQPIGKRTGSSTCPNFQWAIISRQINDGDGDDLKMCIEEMREIKKKQGATVEELSAHF